MKDEQNGHSGPLQKRREPAGERSGEEQVYEASGTGPGQARVPRATPAHFNAWVVIDILIARWPWLLAGAAVFAGLFFLLGDSLIKPKFTASAQLLRYQPPGDEDFFKSGQLTAETFSGLIRAPDLMRKVSEQMADLGIPVIPPEKLVKAIKIEPEPDSDMVKISLAAGNPHHAVDLLNLYVNEAVQFTRELQKQQAMKLANDYLKVQVRQMEQDISVLEDQFRKLPGNPQVTNLLSQIGGSLGSMGTNLAAGGVMNSGLLARQTERLQAALGELNELLVKYTEIHPMVLAKQDEIRSLTNSISRATAAGVPIRMPPGSASNTAARSVDAFNPEVTIVQMRLMSLEDGRVEMLRRQREAALYAADPPGNARVFAPATFKTVEGNMRRVKVAAVTIFGGFFGLGASLLLVGLVEFIDRRLRTADDVKRVTRLPVLAGLGDLNRMSAAERGQWAFRAWTMLQGRLARSNNHGLVCGITCSSQGEGRSTWISLLAEAASLTGFRVLTIATRPSPTHVNSTSEPPEEPGPDYSDVSPQSNGTHALTTSVLSSPMQVTEQLTGPNSQPVVHIPLPGWVWNLERRKQWREALDHWREIDNLVILVELPPASVSEAVLLGSNLPNMLWLTGSGVADAADTRAQLETLRDAHCNLVGALLNRQPGASLKQRFPRWLSGYAVAALAGWVCLNAQAAPVAPAEEENPTPGVYAEDTMVPAGTNAHFSVIGPKQRAAWQNRLTLGPGDIINIGLYGSPELTRSEFAIAPDGRVSYLEAQDVMATGRTIDELRAELDNQLVKYRRAARTIITPVSFKSKRYYLLGKVMSKGVYTLDRPMTVLEAIARAKGAESGLVDRNVIDLADFQRSFLVRNGKRIRLNFDGLFYQGDLSQNIPIEPGDYIYVPGKEVQEVYVVGEVRLPGPVTYTSDLNIIAAIAARGGYTDRSFKMRVMVVRGPVNNPEAIVVDTHATLDGRAPAFQLRPKDIIFVNSRPFILVEEAADLAATAFIQSLITSWVGVDVVSPVD